MTVTQMVIHAPKIALPTDCETEESIKKSPPKNSPETMMKEGNWGTNGPWVYDELYFL
jgi:hypothetical protein